MRQSRHSKVAIKCLDRQNSSMVSNYGSGGSTTTTDHPNATPATDTTNLSTIIQISNNDANNSTAMKPLEEAEREARDKAEKRSIVLFFINVSAAIYVFFFYFITLESLLSIALG